LKISKEAKKLMTKMLQANPEERLTIDQVLLDPWLTKVAQKYSISANVGSVDRLIINNMTNHKKWSFLKHVLVNILIKMSDGNQIAQLTDEFRKIDQDSSGTID
jgi:serine/threonine protein kinase